MKLIKTLVQAIDNNSLEDVKRLLSEGADVHEDDDRALRFASSGDRAKIVKLLLAHGADVHAENDSSLIAACCYGRTATVKLLVAHGADIHADNDCSLECARDNGHKNVVNYLEKLMLIEKLNDIN
jgi:ankyrin repeat protein